MPAGSIIATDLHISRAGLGQMAETIGRDPLYQGKPGFEGMLNDVSIQNGRLF